MGGDALQSQDERLTPLHLVPSGLQPTQSLSPDPQSSEEVGWWCGVGRAAHKCTDPALVLDSLEPDLTVTAGAGSEWELLCSAAAGKGRPLVPGGADVGRHRKAEAW